MARIRTLQFLPEIFQTATNAEFLAATLDQIVSSPSTQRIQGYIGSKNGYGVNAKDYYVTEPTKTRTDYQLDPGVIFTKTNESVAQDFISYPGILDALKLQGGITTNNARLFNSEFYSWDSFTHLDKLINFNEYYWLPVGPPAVTVGASTVYSSETYIVNSLSNAYDISVSGSAASSLNPTLTLMRGGIYSFSVSQATQFWIQTFPGVSGLNPVQINQSTREVYGVTNNGANTGSVVFVVPQKDSQDQFNFPGNNTVDVVSTLTFAEVNGALLSSLGNIDGITSLNGLTVMFYNTGEPSEIGYVGSYFGETAYDVNDDDIIAPLTLTVASSSTTEFTLSTGDTSMMAVDQTVTFTNPVFGGVTAGQVYYISNIVNATNFTISETLGGADLALSAASGAMTININQGLFEEGYYTNVSENFYTIEYVGEADNPILRLIPTGTIPNNQRITPIFGTQWISRGFYRNDLGVISLIPQITAPIDTLYYQDGTSPNKVGIIRLIENNVDNTIDVEEDILGRSTYTAPNGVVFTNGLKVLFDGDVIPASYLTGEYYVEGVGTAIELVPTTSLVSPEGFTQGEFIPFDTTGFDIGNFDSDLYVPVDADYITIARNSICKNAWSRSNRWFHSDVINATAAYNNTPDVVTTYATAANKAKRPIIEFYPNLKLFNSGTLGKSAVDFMDTRATDALSTVSNTKAYYPDVETYTSYTATVAPVTGTSTTITVDADAVTGTFQIGMFVGDSNGNLPINSQITTITGTTTLTLTIEWDDSATVASATNVSIIGTDTRVDNYSIFPGARIVFSADEDPDVRNKVYVANLVQLTPSSDPIITLDLAEDGNVLIDNQIVILRGYNYQGMSYFFDGENWTSAQQKITVNQAPLFDIFDDNGVSFSDTSVYASSSFAGNELFSFGIGTGTDDPILAFPIRYSSIDNVGDISFDVSINLDTFDYVSGTSSITQKVNTGYVYNYSDRTAYVRELGWQTAVAPSTQYQTFNFNYDPLVNSSAAFTCDIEVMADLEEGVRGWPRVQVFNNNEFIQPEDYTVTSTSTSTTITLATAPEETTVIQVMLLSEQVSKVGFYAIPINLNNNPFNEDLTSVNVGDIRSHYRDIFINAPDTEGEIFGSNNFRDCGNLASYGTKIIQNSASLVLPGTFLRKQSHDLFNALMFNSREYIKFKQLIIDTVNRTDFIERYTPSQVLDSALDQITASKSQGNAFFWSDMLPSKAPYRSNTYTFANSMDVTIYPLSKVYEFGSANYNGVLVYLLRTVSNNVTQTQLTSGVDYTINSDAPSLTITLDLQAGDQIVIKEYNQTYGSYVPNTPTKLGMYPAFQPSVVLDSDYSTPTHFIKGHDGSYSKLFGEYDTDLNLLSDYRDQAMLEFELRIYNNLKLSTTVPIETYDVVPGFFRDTMYSWSEWLHLYSPNFLDWVGQNRLDYKTQFYNKNNQYTYNYTNVTNKLTSTVVDQGFWRGVYQYFFDTSTPNLTPWRMLGLVNKPTWWDDRYGPAPYTSDNGVLWSDIEAGLIWNNGDSYVVAELARPNVTEIIPVDSNGALISPFDSIVGGYNQNAFQRDWRVGDNAPVELSYRRSSSYAFDLVRIFALARPAEFFNLAVDLDNYKYNEEFNQYLVNNRSHLKINDVEIYGNGTAKTSYINWIVDYEKQQGIDATTNITTLLDNLDVRLVYRVAGYSDKTLLNFYVEKGSPNSRNASLLIPDESYALLLYDNQPYSRINFSGVIIQQVAGGWTVYGNSQNLAYFTTLAPKYSGSISNLTVQDASVKIATEFYTTEVNIPYGTKFYSYQEVAQFLASYGAWLSSNGMVFDEIVSGIEVNWQLMIQEFMYWIQTGWEAGSVLTLNPAATTLKVNKESQIVQPLTIQNQNFILNQDSYPIQVNTLAIQRDETAFTVRTLNQGDSMSYAQFNLSNFEHGVVFDNTTLFNDVIYNLITGLRQNRITIRGTKSAEWNGTMNAYGFIINQDNIKEWAKELKYTKGEIVKYKNKYWIAVQIIEPSAIFEERKWKITDYNDIQKGMLPNSATRSYESTKYYDINRANLEQDADLLAFSLIGYRPRDYLALADLTDITQINVYKNMIKNKGTRNATSVFKGANLLQGEIDYDIHENWAIKSGEYGGVLNENFVEFRLSQTSLTGNPSIVSLTEGTPTVGSMQEVPLYNLFNYGKAINTPNILTTIDTVPNSQLYPNAGYVNFNDVKMSSYYFSGLPGAVNKSNIVVPINDFYVRDYLWMANFKEQWGTYTFKPIGQVIQIAGNLNQTATVTFNKAHSLAKLDPLAIINFAEDIDGYYLVTEVVSPTQVIINLSIGSISNNVILGQGIAMSLQNQRVATPADINQIDLLDAEFIKNTVWVDENTDGNWAVYRKSINYSNVADLSIDNSGTFGTTVAYEPNVGYLVADPSVGKVYRYGYNVSSDTYNLNETLDEDTSFGTAIAYAQNVYVISEPTSGTPKVYIYTLNDTVVTNDLLLYQTAIPAPMGVTDWGTQVAISGDANWIYVSDTEHTTVYVYRRKNIDWTAGYFTSGQTYVITEVGTTDFTAIGAVENEVGITFVATGVGSGTGTATQITYALSTTIDGTINGATITDSFGSALSTNYCGDILAVGAPTSDYDTTITNTGAAYIYQRTYQNIETQYTSIPNIAQTFQLAWTPVVASTITADEVSSDYITCSANMTGFSVNDPVMFTGLVFGSSGIESDTVYYIHSIDGGGPGPTTHNIKIKTSRSSVTAVDLTNAAGLSFNVNVQTVPLYVAVNGTTVDDNNYATVGNTLYYTGTLQAGDIVKVSDDQFMMVQKLISDDLTRSNIEFGTALDMSKYGSELLVGSPYEIDSDDNEGIVYRYTNGGAEYGVIIAQNECNLLASRQILLNGFLVNLPAGDAETAAEAINTSRIPNIEASVTSDNTLMIQLINRALAQVNNRLVISTFNPSTLAELGVSIYTNTQLLTCPHTNGPTQFGHVIKFNDYGSVVISAPVGTRYEGTTFDFTDDENLDNDTIFDNNSTRFVDTYQNAGAVYMFDYLGKYNEGITNAGAFVYAQTVNSTETDFGAEPLYGNAVDFNGYTVVVGSPQYLSTTVGGQALIFTNEVGESDWAVYRQSADIVDITKVQNSQIFSAETNNTLVNLDYLDPLQDKLLGVVRQNIDFISSIDPARYNSLLDQPIIGTWGASQVGRMWLNTANIRWVNYHQNDAAYNAKHWGTLFPGSDVEVNTWVASNVPPSQYAGPGTPIDTESYVISSVLNASNIAVPVYYFWARNTAIISKKLGKTLSDTILANYITNPQGSGIPYFAPLASNAFGLYNSQEFINANDSVFHIGYANGVSEDASHDEFTLIRENFANDFLPGLPSAGIHTHTQQIHAGFLQLNTGFAPESLYARLLDSLSGCDPSGSVVPNPYLPKAVQTGVLARPRQSFFYNRYDGVKNYLLFANDVLAQFPIREIRPNATFLFVTGEDYDTSDYWEYANWWAEGYDNNTKSAIQVPLYADLAELSVVADTLVTVEQNGAGLFEVYRYDGDDVWTRIGLENGTIQFKSYLWDYDAANLGFSGDFFDSSPFDLYPSEETRNIVRALSEQIYTGDLLIYRNQSLILLFEYIQSETTESQNFLPWLSKTSLVDVSHTIRELLPYEVFKSDNQEFLAGYINEVKPYHVVVKEFIFKYTGTEEYSGTFTDFDLPATYNTEYQKYITPQLVYTDPSNEYEYGVNDDIWSTAPYSEWFSNRGVSIVGQDNYNITTLNSYLDLSVNYVIVDNAQGFPINGVIQIGDEKITYSYVDRSLNLLGGLVRGVQNTTVINHIPGEQIHIDLPSVLVLNGGRNYSEPPRVTAWIDTTIYPEPIVPAEFEAVMSLDSIVSISVVNPGQGYAVLPEIRIDPASVMSFDADVINSTLHTLKLYAPNLNTGDLVQFIEGTNGIGIGNLANRQWYYVNVLESSPNTIISLYTNYSAALNDVDRIQIYSVGESDDLRLAAGARASAITSASPIRENNITMKFDRTTYTSQVIDWEAGRFYGSFFAGSYTNPESISSSSIQLQSIRPEISTVLASAQGVVFEITEVENDRELEWSSFVRYVTSTDSTDNSIRLIPQDGNNDPLNPEPNASGTTIGFYVGMPIKFEGAVVGGLVNGQQYFVKEILSDLDFTISETENGAVMVLTTATVNLQGLACYSGEVTDTAVLTVNYPGILTVTATTASTNKLTVPLSAIGTGGTIGMYMGLPLFFIDPVFGGIVANQNYYVTTVVDNETFTMSETEEPVFTEVSGASAATDAVTVDSTDGFAVNDAIIFVEMVDGSGNPLTTYGNIVSGTTYYVSEVLSGTTMTISTLVNGAVFALANQTGTATVVNQKDTVTLTTETGEMTVNVSLPISPGQVNGQLFSLYNTSEQYPNINYGTVGGLIERTINATIGDGTALGANRIALRESEGGTDNFYENMPIRVNTNIDVLTTGTTYYVIEYSGMIDPLDPDEILPNIEVSITATSSSTNRMTCNTTESLYDDMMIVFSGESLGGVIIGLEYYISSIISPTQFTISETPGGSVKTLTTSNGVMVGTGDPYIIVSTTSGGAAVDLTTDIAGSSLTQFILAVPTFDLSYILGGYRALITDVGEGFAVSNTISIPGTAVAGTTPGNDITLTVNEIDVDGGIVDVICAGTVPEVTTQYYLKVISPTQMEVYSNPLLTVPVSGIDFAFTGFTTDTVTGVNSGTDALTISDTSQFTVNDAVVFTGETNTAITNITAGTTYYVLAILSATTLTISTVPGDAGTIVNMVSTIAVDFTIGKPGSFALLPEPFYFNQSIVKFNNRVYVCVISNNDDEFVFGKWELLDSGDRRLNALDRVAGYYQPTINMPGVDMTQLFDGVSNPNSIYQGNPFQPDEQYTIDTVLQDQPFYPNNVSIQAVLWNGTKYVAVANFAEYSALLNSTLDDTWDIAKITNANISATDITFSGGMYTLTSSNTATPIFRSTDGIVWSASGNLIPYGSTTPASITSGALELNAIAYQSSRWVAVGNSIISSTDGITWTEGVDFNPVFTCELYDVAAVTLPAFTGFIAVGKGLRYDYSTGVTELVDTNLINYSSNGLDWTAVNTITPNGLNGVASTSTMALAVGDEGIVYCSENGANWLGVNEVTVISVNSSTDEMNVTNTAGFAVNDTVRFTESFSSIVAGTTYYILTVVSPTQVTLSATMGGSVFTLTAAGTIAEQTRMYLYDAADPTPADLLDVVYAHSVWIAVGEEGTIKTSPDGLVWTTRTSGTTETLNGISYNSNAVAFIAVGENNTIIVSEDDGVTWTSVSLFNIETPAYEVVGAAFQYGYGPEELVPGLISDNLNISVVTSPGTTWEVTEYGHTGLFVGSLEVEPTEEFQVEYSFDGIAETPAYLTVWVLDATTGLGTTIYDYTVNWVNKTLTLSAPLAFSPKESLRIDVYEIGNGNQIVKNSTDYRPIRDNESSGFNEIYLNCNFSAPIYEGSGIIRTGQTVVIVNATETDGATNAILCEDVSNFVVNSRITFQGLTFGNILEDTDYYIKTISTATNSIVVSASYNLITGLAGPTFILTSATGDMYVNVEVGNTSVWSDPLVIHNGTQLVLGTTGTVTRSKSSNNAFTTATTTGMMVNAPIMFCNNLFTNVIDPMTTYYVLTIIDSNEFTISDTPGGSIIVLDDATGGTTFVTSDYAFAMQPNDIAAKIIFATDQYENTTDYIVYSIFGETNPDQYGFSVLQSQGYTGDGVETVFALDNYVGGDNPENAVVEIDGLRLDTADYTINDTTNEITFVAPPANSADVYVHTFGDTQRQYLTSQFGITSITVADISTLTNVIAPPIASTTATATTAGAPNEITVGSTTGFVVGQPVQFYGTSFDASIAVDGTIYFVETIVNGTTFTIENYAGTTIVLTGGAGVMAVRVGGTPAVRITTAIEHGLSENDYIRIDGIVGTVELNNNNYYVKIISPYTFDLYNDTYDPSIIATNDPVVNVSSYVSGGYVWKEGTFFLTTTTATATTTGTNLITVGTTTPLVVGTPIYFTEDQTPFGATLTGGLVQGTEYFVLEIVNATQFTVSITRAGNEFALATDTGTTNVTQWSQQNVDRLWITINGKRVPSSKLRINAPNQVSILTRIINTDEVIMTNMIPTATPNQEMYMNLVNAANEATVYRMSNPNITWLTQPIYDLSGIIYVDDVTKVTREIIQNETVPAVDAGYYYIGINADKTMITNIELYNDTTNAVISSDNYSIEIVDLSPTLKITAGVYIAEGDLVTVTTLEGNTLYVNGEQIRFSTVDFNNNTISGIQRGVNGTAKQDTIPVYTQVYGLITTNKMPESYYDETWNSTTYNATEGDPLQISTTDAAVFLNS